MPDLTLLKPEQAGIPEESPPAVRKISGKSGRPGQGGKGAARLFPVPRTLGSFAILITILAFIAGWARNELALTLLGTVFLATLGYCYLGVLFLGLLHRRKAMALSMVIAAETVNAGKDGELVIKTGSGEGPKANWFWRLPAILVRCELCLSTRDGRVIRHYADPGFENYSRFTVKERGAYYSELQSGSGDRFTVFDAPGFFRFSLPLPGSENARLLALPRPSDDPLSIALSSGGVEQRTEPHYRKSDELTDHRPYIPGDDPRRINWKLYSHAPLGDLFVREGEPEPPPRSRLLILIDTEAESALYSADEARRAVDLLCENALAVALDFSSLGMDILIGYTGGSISGGKEESAPLDAGELAAALAFPAAIYRSAGTAELPRTDLPGANLDLRRADLRRANLDLPPAPGDRAVLILALPRTSADTSALDRFLKKREPKQETDIVFLYNPLDSRAAELEDSARVCVNLYNGKAGIHAVKAAVLAAGEKKAP
ncbi:MAG: DUF58 domain-containing protein [Treponema sp.]|nr:DUF58 domain-containing protein [Treponema sp.]